MAKINKDNPTVMLPLPPELLLQNYFGLFAMCLSIFSPDLFLGPDFVNLNHSENWFKGKTIDTADYGIKYVHNPDINLEDSVDIVRINHLTEDEQLLTSQPKILWQLQKTIAIMNSQTSKRPYISNRVFSICLDDSIKKRIKTSNHLYEILPTFIRALISNCKNVPSLNQGRLKKMFVSSTYHQLVENKSPTKVSLFLFHFLPEEYQSTLYKMFNSSLFPQEDELLRNLNKKNENPGNNNNNNDFTLEESSSLHDVSTIITIIFDEMDKDTQESPRSEGVEIPFEFYPQLYTQQCKKKLLNEVLKERIENKQRSKKIIEELNRLKSYEGKDILRFLNSSLEYLHEDGKSGQMVNWLNEIKVQLNKCKKQKMDEYKNNTKLLQGQLNIDRPENGLITMAKELNLIGEPHILIMAVLSPYLYFFRNRQNEWYKYEGSLLGKHFTVNKCQKEQEVQDAIKQNTKSANETPIMFVYCKKDSIPSEEILWQHIAMNQGVCDFVEADEKSLDPLN